MIDPAARVRYAWGLLIATLIAWPVTAMTVFKHEPQGILGLSYLAIALTALEIVISTDVRKKQEEENEAQVS